MKVCSAAGYGVSSKIVGSFEMSRVMLLTFAVHLGNV